MKMDQVKMLTKKMVRMGDMFGRVNHAGSLPPSPPPPPPLRWRVRVATDEYMHDLVVGY